MFVLVKLLWCDYSNCNIAIIVVKICISFWMTQKRHWAMNSRFYITGHLLKVIFTEPSRPVSRPSLTWNILILSSLKLTVPLYSVPFNFWHSTVIVSLIWFRPCCCMHLKQTFNQPPSYNLVFRPFPYVSLNLLLKRSSLVSYNWNQLKSGA